MKKNNHICFCQLHHGNNFPAVPFELAFTGLHYGSSQFYQERVEIAQAGFHDGFVTVFHPVRDILIADVSVINLFCLS